MKTSKTVSRVLSSNRLISHRLTGSSSRSVQNASRQVASNTPTSVRMSRSVSSLQDSNSIIARSIRNSSSSSAMPVSASLRPKSRALPIARTDAIEFIKHIITLPPPGSEHSLFPQLHETTTPELITPASSWKEGKALFDQLELGEARKNGFMGIGASKVAIKV